jgi:hypothetical protein
LNCLNVDTAISALIKGLSYVNLKNILQETFKEESFTLRQNSARTVVIDVLVDKLNTLHPHIPRVFANIFEKLKLVIDFIPIIPHSFQIE